MGRNLSQSPVRDRHRSSHRGRDRDASPVREKQRSSRNNNKSPRKREMSRSPSPLPPPPPPARHRSSQKDRSPVEKERNSYRPRSLSPRTKRLRRAQDEKEGEKTRDGEIERNHEKKGSEKGGTRRGREGDREDYERNHGKGSDRGSRREREGEREVERNHRERGESEVGKEKRSGRDEIEGKSSSRGRRGGRSTSPLESDRRNRSKQRSRSPPSHSDRDRNEGFLAYVCRNDDDDNYDDSVAKMKAAEEALEAKKKQQPSFELSGKLAAETNRVRGVTLLFTEPPDAKKPNVRWRLYVFKGGEALNEAARTCILSKQWLDIWRNAMNIDFNENFFVKHHEPEENRKVQREAFINFARQFIANYSEEFVKTLALKCSKPGDFLDDMQNIIMFAISCNVKKLRLDFSDPTWREEETENHEAVFDLPLQAYESGQALESLSLFSCSFDASKFTNFSAIKSLSLGWIRISMGSILAILKSCPLLESLSLKKCWDLEYFDVSIPDLRLQSLVLDKCDFGDDWLSIEGPKFHYFEYSGKLGQFHLENQSALVEAKLDFGMQTEFEEVGVYLYDLLQELFAATTLTVCSVFLQIIPSGDEPMALQAPLNVRNLILKIALHSNEYWGIRFMIRSCPYLETLTIDIGPARIFADYQPPYPFIPEEFWSKNLHIETCVVSSLRVVNVKGFKGTINELYVLRYFLHFGRVMEELNLYVPNEPGENGENREFYMGQAQRVLEFHKASRNLSISVL
ncbi:unnamed protein product [Dovyalis caffra]|uniref:FBD domain-containing protein n=1 Tax=Dovyalis caffra TaxID=77055 RepID=A0AAV1RQ50_9ROSI|nr:unnamed protein product [Dovyalis caffra]